MERKNYIGITVGIIALVIIAVFYFNRKEPVEAIPIPTENWETATTTAPGITLEYPTDLGTKYITPTDWPPRLNIVDEKFFCTEAGAETGPAGETKLEKVSGHEYCVTRVTEGAAGSSYTQYAYARASGSKTEILTFSLRFVNCDNYDEPNRIECKNERESFNISPVVDRMFAMLARS